MQTSIKSFFNLSLQHHQNQHGHSAKILHVYRLVIATLLFAQIILPEQPFLQVENTELYTWVSFIYLISALFWILISWQTHKKDEQLISVQIYLDIVTIIILMHACGGVESGLGILLIINIVMTSLLCAQSLTIIFAALTSIGLLAEYIYANFSHLGQGNSSTQVGLLGIALFATAYVSIRLTSEVEQTTAIAKQQQSDLKNLSALNDYIIDTMQSGVIVLDRNHHIQHINNAAYSLLHFKNALSLPLRTSHTALYELFSHWKKVTNHKNHLYLPKESGIDNVQIRFKDITNENQQGYLIFLDDLSLIHKQANQSKLAALGHLTANIAHEIRNPLGAISHASQLLAESDHLDQTNQRMTEIIQQHTGRINHIIEDVLQISRSKKSQRECIAIESWLKQFIQDFCLSSQHANPAECFKLEIATNNSFILFDSGHLNQILTNICQNAQMHGVKNRPIHIISSKDERQFTIEIADEGPGIKSEHLSQITEPFYTTSSEGSGLGLYIVSQLCEINSAKLAINSNQYNGTSLKITCQLIDQ